MTEQSEKQPGQAPSTEPFQTPEAPNPGDAVAVTAPSRKRTPPGQAPPVPAAQYDFDPEDVQRSRANVFSPAMTLNRPALGRLSAMGTDLLGDCAIATGLGVRQPVKLKVTFSKDNKWCFLMPVHSTATRAIKVTYNRGQAYLNLWGPFEGKDKIVEKGYRELYDLWMTEEPITIHDQTGFALYFSMESYERESLSKRDDEPAATAKSTTTADATKSKKSEKASPKGEGDSTEESLLEIYETELADKAEHELVLLGMIDQKDAQIKALEERLKALEAKLTQGK